MGTKGFERNLGGLRWPHNLSGAHDQEKVIRVKGLRIFEDYETKAATERPDYNESKPKFQGFLLEDNDEEEPNDLPMTRDSRKVKDAKKTKQPAPIARAGQKVIEAELLTEAERSTTLSF